MGRKPTKPGAIPNLRKRVRGNKTWYYYDHGGRPRREEALGCDYGLAIKRWAELENASEIPAPAIVTFRHVADAYRKAVIPTKAERTQADNAKELTRLLAFFDDPPGPFEAIEPQHVKLYLKWRKDAPVRAKREKALLSHIWNWACGEGYTALRNPCAGIKGKKTKGRDAYIEDFQFKAIWTHASVVLQDAMDLSYLTGQRPADVLRMSEHDVRDGSVNVRQGKTQTKVRIEEVGELAKVLARIRTRKSGYQVWNTRLVVNEDGKPIGQNAISRHWVAACKLAKVVGLQYRDLRAKAATDTEESTGNIRSAQKQLGHASVTMTEHYVRNRRGAKVMPTGHKALESIPQSENAPHGNLLSGQAK